MAAFIGLTAGAPDSQSLGQIIAITLPATIVGVLAAAALLHALGQGPRRRPGLPRTPRRWQDQALQPRRRGQAADAAARQAGGARLPLGRARRRHPRRFQRTAAQWTVDGKTTSLSLTTLLIMVMLVVALIVMYVGRITPAAILDAPLTKSGLTAIIALLGIAWLANTFIAANQSTVIGALTDIAKSAPWFLAVGIFLVAAMTTSQSAAVNTMIPLGLGLGIGVPQLAAYLPAMGGVMVLPANGSQLAAVEIDQTGSTRIGQYVFNHSFIVPTLVMVVVSVVVAILLGLLIG